MKQENINSKANYQPPRVLFHLLRSFYNYRFAKYPSILLLSMNGWKEKRPYQVSACHTRRKRLFFADQSLKASVGGTRKINCLIPVPQEANDWVGFFVFFLSLPLVGCVSPSLYSSIHSNRYYILWHRPYYEGNKKKVWKFSPLLKHPQCPHPSGAGCGLRLHETGASLRAFNDLQRSRIRTPQIQKQLLSQTHYGTNGSIPLYLGLHLSSQIRGACKEQICRRLFSSQ